LRKKELENRDREGERLKNYDTVAEIRIEIIGGIFYVD